MIALADSLIQSAAAAVGAQVDDQGSDSGCK
jgi:hypothetical protein